jgi:hypothetical protein
VTPASLGVIGDPTGLLHGRMQSDSAHTLTEPLMTADAFDSHPPVVMMRGKNNSTFLISWRSQRDFARSLAWKCMLMIWGGPALSLVCLYGLHVLAHWF